jgi:hypothetical protein
MQRPAPRVAEEVEDPLSLNPAAQGQMVLLLVEKVPGLLTPGDVDAEVQPVLFGQHFRRQHAVEQLHLLWQSLQFPYRYVIAGDDGGRGKQLLQRLHNRLAPAFHPQGEELNRENLTVAVDHQSGETVALPVHQAQGGQFAVQPAAIVEGGGESPAEKFDGIDVFLFAAEEAAGDQRVRIVVGGAETVAAGAENQDGIPAVGDAVNAVDLVAEDPGMPRPQAAVVSRPQDEPGHQHRSPPRRAPTICRASAEVT